MSLLAASFLSREVRVCVLRGPDLTPLWITGWCEPPPLWAALAVLTAGNVDEEDDETEGAVADTAGALREVARAWLPWRLADQVLGLADEPLADVLNALVAYTAGLTDAERKRARKAQAPIEENVSTETPGPDRWDTVVTETAIQLGISPADVLRMPWPAFLQIGRTMPGVRAEEQRRAIGAAAFPHMDRRGQRAALRALEAADETPEQTEAQREQARADAEHVRRQVEHFLEHGTTLYNDQPAEA